MQDRKSQFPDGSKTTTNLLEQEKVVDKIILSVTLWESGLQKTVCLCTVKPAGLDFPVRVRHKNKSSHHHTTDRKLKRVVKSSSHHQKVVYLLDGYFFSYFANTMRISPAYRHCVLTRHLKHHSTALSQGSGEEKLEIDCGFEVRLTESTKHYLDMIGNNLVVKLVHEKIELDNTLSWLSSLGGAFSALGDLSSSWAKQAGHISMQQLQIAIKLGDPFIVSRCHLYAAISLIQHGAFKWAKKIILNEYHYAKSLPVGTDPRLIKMCIGIWSKLKYAMSLHHSTRTTNKTKLHNDQDQDQTTQPQPHNKKLLNKLYPTSNEKQVIQLPQDEIQALCLS